MSCCHYYEFTDGHEQVFAVDPGALRLGRGALGEAGPALRALGVRRLALFTDPRVAALPGFAEIESSLKASGVDFAVYDEVHVEPTDASFAAAARFAREGRFDGYLSFGGGSVIDTAKAANLYATWPAEFLAYVNAPIGEGRAVPGPLRPHVACPTTSGTGSECTGIAVFDLLEMRVKTGIAARALRPSLALVDPSVTASLPEQVVAASGFDVLSHALESWTARPFSERARSPDPQARPMSQGANPWSDLGCREALRLCGRFLRRAVADAADTEAREGMMFAATLAGIAFGNSGVHVPHGMAYSVAGLIRDYHPRDYPGTEPICPHGISVIVDAPAAFRFTAPACPQRHLEAAALLGAHTADAGPEDSGEVLATHLLEMMRACDIPNGIDALGYGEADIEPLARGAFAQQRLLANAPRPVGEEDLRGIYRAALRYW